MREPERWMAVLAAVWLGGLLSVAVIATPAAFAVLAPAEAGRVAGRILASEAASSLVVAAMLLALHRWRARIRSGQAGIKRFDAELACVAGALFCTLAGHYALLPMMADARAGHGVLSFGQLHTISVAFYVVKLVLVGWMAVRLVFSVNPKPAS